MSPVRSPSLRAVNATFVVAVKAGAGNFWSNRFGMSQKFLAALGNGTANNLRKPYAAEGKAQFDCGLACHCHWRPILCSSNSSESGGVPIGYDLPTLGLRLVRIGSPVPSRFGLMPIIGQSFTHFIGCRCTTRP